MTPDKDTLCPNSRCAERNIPPEASSCPTCGGPKLIDRKYRLLKTLGQGGVGRTYLAQDIRFAGTPDEFCVVKELLESMDENEQSVRLLKREAGRLLNIRNPGIPSFRDFIHESFGENNTRWFLVQQYVNGKSLQNHIDQSGPLPIEQVMLWMVEVLKILDYLHNLKNAHTGEIEPLMHLDLKPDNMMIRESDGQIFVIDFGLAAQVNMTVLPSQGARASIHGFTPGFAPFEQTVGYAAPGSDLYSWAMTFLVAVTGCSPMQLVNPIEQTVYFEDHITLSTKLGDILKQTLSIQLKQRPADAMSLLRALSATDEFKQLFASSDFIIPENDTHSLNEDGSEDKPKQSGGIPTGVIAESSVAEQGKKSQGIPTGVLQEGQVSSAIPTGQIIPSEQTVNDGLVHSANASSEEAATVPEFSYEKMLEEARHKKGATEKSVSHGKYVAFGFGVVCALLLIIGAFSYFQSPEKKANQGKNQLKNRTPVVNDKKADAGVAAVSSPDSLLPERKAAVPPPERVKKRRVTKPTRRSRFTKRRKTKIRSRRRVRRRTKGLKVTRSKTFANAGYLRKLRNSRFYGNHSALINKLNHGNSFIRAQSARTLGTLGPQARILIPKFLDMYQQENDSFPRRNLEYVFGRLRVKAAAPFLANSLGDRTYSNSNAITALHKIGRTSIPIMELLLRKGSQAQQADALQVLARFGPNASEALPTIIKVLKNGNPKVQKQAAYTIRKMGTRGAKAIPALHTTLRKAIRLQKGSDRTALLYGLITALGAQKDNAKEAIPTLAKLTHSSSMFLVSAASNSLAKIGSASVPAMLKLLRSSKLKESSKRSVMRALLSLGSKAAVAIKPLTAMLPKSKGSIREMIIRFFGKMGKRAAPAIPQLKRVFQGQRKREIWLASESLSLIGANATPVMIKALSHQNPYVRMAAAYHIGWIKPKATEALPALKKAMKDENYQVRKKAKISYSRIKGR